MHPCSQSESLGEVHVQDLAPATPSHSQQDNSSSALQSDREISSNTGRRRFQQQTLRPAQTDLCRADLSGAALLISQEFATLCPPEEPAINVGNSPLPQRKVFQNGNYNRYYGYRLAKGETEDPRLQVGLAPVEPFSEMILRILHDGTYFRLYDCLVQLEGPVLISLRKEVHRTAKRLSVTSRPSRHFLIVPSNDELRFWSKEISD